MPWLPSALASWSRSTASVMNPSATSWRPIGRPVAFCSFRPMRNWSRVISPWVTRVSPMRSFLRRSMATLPNRFQLLHARFGLGSVVTVLAIAGERFLVIHQRAGILMQLVEADGQVEGVIGVVWRALIGLEIGGLGVVPAPLLGVEIAERLVELRAGRAFDQLFQPAFGDLAVGIVQQVEQGALGDCIAGIDLEYFAIQAPGIRIAVLRTGDGCESQ